MEIEIYSDECRQDLLINKDIITNNNRYVVLGGIWIQKGKREEFKNKIKELINKYDVHGEFKWKRVSINKIDFYKELIHLFFDFKEIAFRALVIDSKLFDINDYHSGSFELGFYKCYYQLLKEWIKKSNNYYIFLDSKKDKLKRRTNDLKMCLNNNIKKDCVKNIQLINSKESLLLQLEDIIMGCIAYKFNYEYNGVSTAKNELLKEFEKNFIINETGVNRKKINIFKIKLKGGKNE